MWQVVQRTLRVLHLGHLVAHLVALHPAVVLADLVAGRPADLAGPHLGDASSLLACLHLAVLPRHHPAGRVRHLAGPHLGHAVVLLVRHHLAVMLGDLVAGRPHIWRVLTSGTIVQRLHVTILQWTFRCMWQVVKRTLRVFTSGTQ